MKKISNIAATMLAAATLMVACSPGESKIPSNTAADNLPKTKIDANIDSMAAADWSREAYTEILERQINASSSFLPSDKQSLTKKLNEKYSDQIVRCAGEILHSGCSPRHAELNGMLVELTRIEPEMNGYVPAGKDKVLSEKAEHDKDLSFSISSAYSAKNWTDSYDASYDKKKQAEAAAIRAKNPTCRAIQEKVSSSRIASVLADRKKNYYSSIVNIYCNRSDWNVGQHNTIVSKISGAPNYAALKARLDKFKEEHKPQ